MQNLFRTFSPLELSKVIIAMLSAQHIFVVATSATRLTPIAAALPLLIEPLRWNLNVIPILPLQLREALQIPVPTMIGVTCSTFLSDNGIGTHLVLNVDAGVAIEHHQIQSQPLAFLNQCAFAEDVSKILKNWENAPGFPFHKISVLCQRFIVT